MKYPINKNIIKIIADNSKHYLAGSKALGVETLESMKILGKYMQGTNITTLGKYHLKKNGSDLLRLAPFSVFIIVPFFEVFIPAYVKLFPTFLPRVYETDRQRLHREEMTLKAKEDKLKKMLSNLLDDLKHWAPGSSIQAILNNSNSSDIFQNIDEIGKRAQLLNGFFKNNNLTMDILSYATKRQLIKYLNTNLYIPFYFSLDTNLLRCTTKFLKYDNKHLNALATYLNNIDLETDTVGNIVSDDQRTKILNIIRHEFRLKGIELNNLSYNETIQLLGIWVKAGHALPPIPSVISKILTFTPLLTRKFK